MAETSDINPIVTMETIPLEMLDEILDKLEPIEKLVCKRVCRKFYGSVNRVNPGFSSINVLTEGIWFGKLSQGNLLSRGYNHEKPSSPEVSYRNRGNDCLVRYDRKTKIIENSNYLDVMVMDLFSVLKSPRLNLKALLFSCDDNSVFAKIHEMAVRNGLTNIRTEHLLIETHPMHPALTTIFNLFNYNTLHIFFTETNIEGPNLQLLERRYREIFELVPAGVKVTLFAPWFDTLPIESFLKFKRIELNFKSFSCLSGRKVGNIIQVLLTSNVLDSCVLSAKYQKDDVIKILKDEVHFRGNNNIFKVRIADKNERFSVEVLEKEIKITRIGN
ncbi:hypothetical protein CAEBREN_17072 [Caenorhabditis brenneri]|uniref:F-box domain-containing protein n=1 Tax=Caenorhabditis brenneri TaxID=135651 RepID=G0NC54_CAEBE|nr:hypothetical protein CAEBREN_17072 [Caenorhabditis brenneri]